MKHISTLSLLLLPLAAPVLYAQSPLPPAPAADEAKAHAPLAEDGLMHRGKLDNGLSYLIRPTKEPAGQASMRLYVDTGSLNESEETKGISHFIEHMVFNGSRHFKRGELIPAMQNLGLGFGGDANAYTGLLQTVYMLDLPNTKPETVDFALTIMRDFADGATLEDDAIDHERGIIVSELKSRDSAAYRAGIDTLRKLVGGTRVPDYLPIGTEEVIRNCPYETIRAYYRDNYVPERMTFIITGDVDPAQAEQWVREHFSSMEKRPNPVRPAIGSPADTGAGSFIIPNAETATTTISLSVVKPWQARPDTLEQRMADLPLELACSMLNNRLSRMSRQADSPFLSSAAEAREELFDAAELFALRVLTHPEQWKEGLSAAEAELRRAAIHGFSQTELMEVVAAIHAASRKSIDTWETIAADTIADGLVGSISDKKLFTPPVEDARAWAAGLERVLANPDICREALARAYKAERTRLILTGKVAEDATPENLSAAYASARSQEVTPREEEKLAPFAYDHIGEPGKVVNRQSYEDVGVTTLTLSNGVRVNLKPIDFKKGSIYVSAAVDGGLMRLPRVPALAQMVDAVMSQGGLEAHSEDELARLLAGNDVSCSFGISDERFTFTGNTSPRELELQCKLLCAAILHPGFRPEGEQQLRRALPSFFSRMETTPKGAYDKQSTRLLFGDDLRFLTPTEEQFAAVDTAAVKEAITPFLQKGAIEVSLVGDFKVEEVLPVLERSFGAMPQRSPEFAPLTEEPRRVTYLPWGQREVLRYPPQLDKPRVSQVRYVGDGNDLHRNRRLTVLRSIVHERLFDTIRAQLGEAYSPSTSLAMRSGYENAATFTASSYGVKRNREKVNSAMDLVFSSIGRGEITEEEFQQAIRPYIADADESYRLPGFWAGSIARLQSEPHRLDLLRDLREDARNITLEEIRTLGKEIFGSDKVNYYFTVPQNYEVKGQAAPEAAEAPAEAAPADEKKEALTASPAEGADSYAVFCTPRVKEDPAWNAVVEALLRKHPGSYAVVLPDSPETSGTPFIAAALRAQGARYAAFVLKPEEIGRETVNSLHRAARMVDDDPWGDCLWGIVTGASAQDALRLATASEPLTIKRLLGTTNVGAAPFEQSCCITDWTNAPVLSQSGYTEPKVDELPGVEGREQLFAEQLATQKPQFIVTSSHATQFNLEMPFGRGLIFPAQGRFHLLTKQQMPQFGAALGAAMQGNTRLLEQLAEKLACPTIEPDGEPRVWLAAGNCLFGNAQHSANSMAVTALSAYTCNQVVGYTVPSWYGKGGWGTLSLFCENTDGTSLAEAWFLNNQFILHETQQLAPELLGVSFDEEELNARFFQSLVPVITAAQLPRDKAQDTLGLVHDRDVVAFYGDPAWRATIDSSHCSRPFRIEWQGDKCFTLTANSDRKGRAAVWFPTAATGKNATGCDAPGAVFTNDFILFPELEMKKGEVLTVTIH